MNYSLTLRGDKGSKLTIEEMDSNFLYLQELSTDIQIQVNELSDNASITRISPSDAYNLINFSNGVIQGHKYLIVGAHSNLYGGTDVLVYGTSENSFSARGYGKFINPNYSVYSVWDVNESYGVDTLLIYGGSVWKNIGGVTGSSNDFFNLDDNWEKQAYTPDNDYYKISWDEITYDVNNDMILSRYEVLSNNRVITTALTSSWFFCGFNPIKVFRWGHPYNGDSGIGSCTIDNSYCESLNIYDNSSMTAITLTNYSIITNVGLRGSYLQKITLDNNCQLCFLDLDQSSIYSLTMTNDCTIIGNTLVDCSFYDVIFNNNCYFENNYMHNGAIYNLEFLNSNINGNYFDTFNITNWRLENDSYIGSITIINGSGFSNITLNNSLLANCTLDGGCSWNHIHMTDSIIEWSNLSNNSSFDNINMTNNSDMNSCFLSDSSWFGNINASNGSLQLTLNNGSSLWTLDLNTGSMTGTLNSSSYELMNMNGSWLQIFNVNNSSIANFVMSGFALIYPWSIDNMILRNCSYTFNTIKLMVNDLSFDGSVNKGAIGDWELPCVLIPEGFFCESVLMDCDELIKNDGSGEGNGTDPIINIGFYASNDYAIIDSQIGQMKFLSSKISAFSLTNGELSGIKSTGYEGYPTRLVASISSNNIVSGVINMELTFKSLKYCYIND